MPAAAFGSPACTGAARQPRDSPATASDASSSTTLCAADHAGLAPDPVLPSHPAFLAAAGGEGRACDPSPPPAAAADERASGGAGGRPRRKKRKRARPVTVTTAACRYDVVRDCCADLGFREVPEADGDWLLYWIDTGVSMERVLSMKPYQTINHFPGMHEICKKNDLARNLGRLQKIFPHEYNFWPKTWLMPYEYLEFATAAKAGGRRKTYIAKPQSGCQGKGIFLFSDTHKLKGETNMIVQEYIRKPLLIGGFKFDFRIYVLVTSCDPLKIYIYEDGLARFATEKYVEASVDNLDNSCMHLTNYAINKHNDKFVWGKSGSKRSLKSLLEMIAQRYDVHLIWSNISDIIIKTLLTVIPSLRRIQQICLQAAGPGKRAGPCRSKCFEVLGFDVMLDRKLKPWVLEVNHSPSFTCDSDLDRAVKSGVIRDALRLVDLDASGPARWMRAEKQRMKSRLLGDPAAGPTSRGAPRQDDAARKAGGAGGANDPAGAGLGRRKSQQKCGKGDSTAKGAEKAGGYQQIFPCDDPRKMAKYEKIIVAASVIFSDTAASKARREFLRQKMLEVETATKPHPKPPQRRAPPAACRNLPSLSTIEQSCEEAAGKPSASSGPVLQQAGSASSATVNDATGLANARGIVVDATSPGRPASGNLPRRGQKPGRMMVSYPIKQVSPAPAPDAFENFARRRWRGAALADGPMATSKYVTLRAISLLKGVEDDHQN